MGKPKKKIDKNSINVGDNYKRADYSDIVIQVDERDVPLTIDDIVRILRERLMIQTRAGVQIWEPRYLFLRRQLLLHLLKKGMTRTTIGMFLQERLGVGTTSCKTYLKDIFDYIKQEDEDIIEDVRLTTQEKLYHIIQECLELRKHKEALQAYDQLNKINGLYTENKNVTINDYTFQFGGDEGVTN